MLKGSRNVLRIYCCLEKLLNSSLPSSLLCRTIESQMLSVINMGNEAVDKCHNIKCSWSFRL
ncbi:hypothetical protein RO3G_15943 [Rhizopus delemar RA 99-880]|uniref:Uncharacterized protein n=1 Tax=Rhizopus delemar (strain RA 99-880 / ATCC MYA-4621 / FGSC 9543 / NRRL 43880) TaxID=246409 RepID=I1CS02_RHIO9|nr:hypothetical protein RO3G_15943 [Rhizopus delemar RA 99-880]|eukprot:EIE91232.1 hypothetical protein RO3G_15943 [Rhizopus delemar RA 99-880]